MTKIRHSYHLALLSIVAIFGACTTDQSTAPVSAPPALSQNLEQHIGDPGFPGSVENSCASRESLLAPNRTTTLFLRPTASNTRYYVGSVSAPVMVSFDFCDMDTTGNLFLRKFQIHGPANQSFLIPVKVEVAYSEVGLTRTSPGNSQVKVFRLNTTTGRWQYHSTTRLLSNHFEYHFTQNGMYVLGYYDSTWTGGTGDTTWTTTGTVTSAGGVLSLRNSSLAVAPGALTQSTLISFTVRTEVPAGLPGALPRVYEFGPEGTKFLTPAILSVSFDDAGMTESLDPTRDEVMKHFYYHDEANNRWIIQETQIDLVNRRFLVRLDHFSRYAFAR